jgi:uncharacterized protein (DUF58 family)
MAGDRGERGAFPSVTVGVFLALALVAALLGALLIALKQAPWMWGAAALALVLAVGNAFGVVRRRHTDDVRRAEARLRRLLSPPRRLRPTREGWWFMGITLLVGVAALNTGNNLLYLLLGMMLSLILASGILSESTLRGLRVERVMPPRIQAMQPALIGITVHNTKRSLPSFSVEVDDIVAAAAGGSPAAAGHIDKRCWFLKLPPGRSQRTAYRHQFPRRGLHRYTGMRLSTKFPFALFRKSREIEAPLDVVVLPRLHPIDQPPLPLRGLAGEEPQGRIHRHGEFWGLREARGGDDARDVHWPASAKRGRLMVREHEREEARRVTLFVDNALPGGDGCSDEKLLAGLERAVSLAASLAAWYVSRGFSVRAVARGEASTWTTGEVPLERLLRQLALLCTVDESVPFAAAAEPGGECLCVVHDGSPPSSGPGRILAA